MLVTNDGGGEDAGGDNILRLSEVADSYRVSASQSMQVTNK